jgi:hypothetical protein
MQFADIRIEWRVEAIETQLRQKAEAHELSSMRSDVDRLERSLREACSQADGLRLELETATQAIAQLAEQLSELRTEVATKGSLA